jgi:hypothetical protein
MAVVAVVAVGVTGCTSSSKHTSPTASADVVAAASSGASAPVSSPGVDGSQPAASASAVGSANAGSSGAPVVAPTTGTTPKAIAKATGKATPKPSTSPSTSAKLTPVPTPTASTPTPVPSNATPTAGGVTVALGSTHTVTSSGTGQGAISGQPAVQFTLTFSNTGSPPVSLDNAVTVEDANKANAWSEDSNDNGDDAPATGTVAANQSISGTYVFVVPSSERGHTGLQILITVNVGAASPVTFMATAN